MINCCSPINFSTPCHAYTNYPLENINNNYPNFIKIYLYQPHMRIQILNIKTDRAISTLSNHYLKEMFFIFNGQILDKEKSFSFYEIPYGSKIAMIPKDVMKSDSSFQEKWIEITCDKEKFDKMIEMSVDANYRKELSRLRDMKYQKMELKKRKHNFFITSNDSYASNTNKDQQNDVYNLYKKGAKIDQVQLNIDYEIEKNPSDQPLPIIW